MKKVENVKKEKIVNENKLIIINTIYGTDNHQFIFYLFHTIFQYNLLNNKYKLYSNISILLLKHKLFLLNLAKQCLILLLTHSIKQVSVLLLICIKNCFNSLSLSDLYFFIKFSDNCLLLGIYLSFIVFLSLSYLYEVYVFNLSVHT